jgi:hypothetical protein
MRLTVYAEVTGRYAVSRNHLTRVAGRPVSRPVARD